MVGADTDMTYPTTHLGDSAETLIDLANGYHPFSQVRRNCSILFKLRVSLTFILYNALPINSYCALCT